MLDVAGIDQPGLEPVRFQQVEDSLPVVRGCLHDHPSHPQLGQPVGHDQQPAGHRLVAPDLLPSVGPSCPWPGTRTQQVSSALPTSNAATRWMISSVSCVSSSTPASLRSDDPTGRLPAGAAGRQANLIRVLEATVKGPGATPSTRLINGLQRPRTSGVSGQPARFSPRNGRLPQGGTAAYQQNAGNRCAHGRCRRSRSTVEGEVMCSHRGQLCALIPAAVSPRLNASFSFLPIDVCSTPQYTAIYLLLCSM